MFNQRTESKAVNRPLSRRKVLNAGVGLAATPLVGGFARAQPDVPTASQVAAQLPLQTKGLEHIGTVVPDVEAGARFFGRVFNPVLYKEQDPPLRYYVTLDPGYIALGSREDESVAFIDHDCVLVDGYDRAAMAQRLKDEGLSPGRFGIIPDPDGLGLQLLGRGGLAGSTEPAGRIVEGEPLVRPRGLHRVLRYVSDLDRSIAFYRKFFGRETTEESNNDRVWFRAAHTYFGLQTAPEGESPRIDRFCVNVAAGGFDRASVGRMLAQLGAQVVSSSDDEFLHFRSPNGLGVELRPVDPARIWGQT